MAILKGLAAAVVLALSISGATACDDYEDQMALAAAIDAAKLAQAATPQPAPTAQVASPASSSSQPTDVAAVETKPGPENSAGPLQR